MTDKRPLIIGLLAVFAVLALGGAYLFEFSRSGQMRSSEADFMARMEAEGRTQQRTVTARPARTASEDETALADWYAATDPGIANPAGAAADGTSTEPEDNSFLINDTRPFGAPMDPGPAEGQPETAAAAPQQ